jgi:dCTP deaminase
MLEKLGYRYVYLPRKNKLAARVEGRRTLARLGLSVHLTAPTIHAGFSGRIALEIYNAGIHVLKLSPGKLHICQLIFERLERVPRLGKPNTTWQGQRSLRKS